MISQNQRIDQCADNQYDDMVAVSFIDKSEKKLIFRVYVFSISLLWYLNKAAKIAPAKRISFGNGKEYSGKKGRGYFNQRPGR